MCSTDNLLRIATTADTDSEIAMMVTPAYDTGLIGNTDVVGEVVVPETLSGNMSGIRIICPLDIAVEEILPCMVVAGLMLIGSGGIEATLIERTDGKVQMIDIAAHLGKGRRDGAGHHYGEKKQLLSHGLLLLQ